MGRGNDHRDRRRQFGAHPVDPWGDYAPQPYSKQPSRQQALRPATEREAEARVKWFNPEKGFGFVELTDGSDEAFLHIRQVEAAGHSALESGTMLIVKVGPGQKGAQVNEILSIDTSTAQPELSRRSSKPAQERQGGFSRQGSAQPVGDRLYVAGVVKWFDPGKGFGFVSVEGESKDLFLHISVVQRSGLSLLREGQAVRVSVVEGRKGREVGALELI